MKKLFARAGLALLCCAASSGFAYDLTLNDSDLKLTINGQACLAGANDPALVSVSVNGVSKTIDVATTSGTFECGGVTVTPPVSSSSSSVSSSSTPASSSSSSAGGGNPPVGNVDLSACGGVWPTTIVEGAVMSLAGTSQTSQTLNGNRTVSFPIQTGNPGLTSTFAIAALSNSLGVTREVTVSACPGGAPVTTGRCSRIGTESISVKILQGTGSASSCMLESNKQYFINVSNVTCANASANCGFYRTIQ